MVQLIQDILLERLKVRTVTEYKIITSPADSFVEKVNQSISQGWMPIGGVVVDMNQWSYAQAMVRYEGQSSEDENNGL